jgi:Cof subfamily protein (haloacid dehalogenase superfamily)
VSDTAIRLLLCDIDGTLVTSQKELTGETIRAVRALEESNVIFTLTSARPPCGFAMFVEPLNLTAPLGAFNGGLLVDRDLSPIHELAIDADLVSPIIDALSTSGLFVWVYQGNEWFVRDLHGPHVARESEVVQFHPVKVANFDDVRENVVKIVGVSDDPMEITKGQSAIRDFDISGTTSQTYYLDVTNHGATKGSVVEFLAQHFSIETSSIATIGDAANDVAMFERSGLSIAMGNASHGVKSSAQLETKSNDDNGLSYAIERFILPRAEA